MTKELVEKLRIINTEVLNKLEKFWKIEELPDSEYYSKEELSCENHFETTFKREQDGRFTVSLPLKENHANLGESLGIAEKRLISMEKKFVRDSSLQGEYRRLNIVERHSRNRTSKMYRQVNIMGSQRDLQRIVWRSDPSGKYNGIATGFTTNRVEIRSEFTIKTL
ncbi:hypothetical protein QE152_g9673 [Popillia japonica]|uniref:Uncharacterized protein n=1 Tax=Popillia japonica TaxID=7064 RepID=A0AAW1LW60_POPJA